MARFTELIKNFDKIRDYARDFLVYGYKCRSDYTRKSSRSYDNERRRIESYLAGYIRGENSSRGKNLFISTDTGDLSQNPLFSVWETKSFTINDCLLHFYLFDILSNHPGLTAQEAADTLSNECLSTFSEHAMPDTMTVRNKLNEYVEVGLFKKIKNGKTLHYYINDSLFNQNLPDLINRLASPIQFFENVTPAGVLGSFIRRDSGQNRGVFSFRHLFTSHTLDDEVLIQILSAIQEKKMIQIETCGSRSKNPFCQIILPLKIAINVKHGRRYLLAYNNRKHNFFSYRLDYLKNVKVLEKYDTFQKQLAELETRLSHTWGVYLGRKNYMEQLEMILSINESTEAYVLTRLKREGKHGIIEKLADNTFAYRIEVTDTQEMVPWLRTFIGRIISINGSNKQVIKQFLDDIERMTHLYEE
ncbi:hypothetical protein SRRS_53850 [Sporomusa rhizae]|uniref:WYL domain-containing protein n=1 Tax=Sporomusa rhizae TaxID=357999 RepID=UPI00352B3F14